ncbi:Predicted dithiol-disulfide oxidoreductase, DUF899 family [Agrococcus baldri]|uniref:Predicted dithiol-disulfide oxidoreductase, DUF899 family n=1 Tax=Agrococcus baldri TaxID=153730 RepID=A0AA94HLT8_9MICO|nr:DUF899 family protein [Agrococcus baldri]SFS08247.1 Predicted dithiol-disulfide oxidoreductase, DUF899 family [Agrococcus baldri]
MTLTDESVPAPPIVDRDAWLREREALLAREKAHTREGDAIAAARRRLPMTEVPSVELVGEHGTVRLLELFDGRPQLVLYKHMWHDGQPIEGQCEGCTATIWDFHDASYPNARGISFAVLSRGPIDELAPFRAFMGYTHPWFSNREVDDPLLGPETEGAYVALLRRGERIFATNWITGRGVEAMMSSMAIADMTAYGRREAWEDSPAGWPQDATFTAWRTDGRPTPQWSRPGATPVDASAHHHH